MITEEIKLVLAINQIQNVLGLIEGNEWENYMNLRLTSVYYELERQLTNQVESITLKK